MRPLFINALSLTLGVIILATSSCSQGDSQKRPLKVGTVDVLRVMEGRPETMDIRLDWTTQAGSTYLELANVTDEKQAEALKVEITKRSAA